MTNLEKYIIKKVVYYLFYQNLLKSCVKDLNTYVDEQFFACYSNLIVL